FPYVRSQLQVVRFHLAPSKDASHLSEQFSRAGKVGGGNEVRIGASSPRPVGGSHRIEPVTKLETLIPEKSIGGFGDKIDPRPHAVKLSDQHAYVAVTLVERPGDHHSSVSPACCRPIVSLYNLWDDIGNATYLRLLGSQVCQPGGQKT